MATITFETDQVLETATASFTAKLRGMTPMLMHRPGSMEANTGETKRTSAKRIPTPQEECDDAVYKDEDGILFLPARWIQRAIVESGKQFQHPQNKRATLMKLLAAALVPPPVLGFPLFHPEDGEAIREYEIDIQRVVVQRAAVMRARPRVDEWTSFINFDVDLGTMQGGVSDDHLREAGKTLLQVLAHAGSKQGLGDFRPEKGGSYGRFKVEQFSISNSDD